MQIKNTGVTDFVTFRGVKKKKKKTIYSIKFFYFKYRFDTKFNGYRIWYFDEKDNDMEYITHRILRKGSITFV